MYVKNKEKEFNEKALLKDAYPISVNNQQCVGPCYYSNTKIIHPLTLDEIKQVEHNFCPVNTFVYTNPITKKSMLFSIDKCLFPTARETKMDDILRENVIVPQFHFSSDYFIKMYYRINNLEDLLDWLNTHTTDPYKTRERVFDNGMIVYGDQITILDHRMVYFVNDVMVHYLPKIYRRLKEYIVVKNDKIELTNANASDFYNFSSNRNDENNDENNDQNENNDQIENDVQNENDEQKQNKLNTKRIIGLVRSYIRDKFLGIDNMQQFMSKFIRYHKEELTSQNLSNVLVNHMINHTIERIKRTLEQE